MLNSEQIIKRLSQVLEVKNDTELAELLGVSKPTISMWKKRNSIPYDQCFKITKSENVSLEWLLTGEGEIYRRTEDIPTWLIYLRNWWETADNTHRCWLEVQLRRCFPEYAEWMAQKEGEK